MIWIFKLSLKTLAKTILNNFCKLTECDDDVYIIGAFIACAYFLEYLSISNCSSFGRVTKISYLVPIKKAWAFY